MADVGGYGCRGNHGYQDGRSLDSESDGRNIAILFLKTRESTGIYGNGEMDRALH